jgi:DNA (cytosine-5)-methyltransferase 1
MAVVCHAIENGQADNTGLHEVPGALNCMHDQQAVMVGVPPRYIVRRLTPTECARLQGFPDTWGHIDLKDDFTEQEYKFWLNVRNTHAGIYGKEVKNYTKKQMLTWYNKLHSDGAEYKLWGNGISLPCALFVMQGIAETEARNV